MRTIAYLLLAVAWCVASPVARAEDNHLVELALVEETHASLAKPPAGAAEVLSGTFTSFVLGQEVPFRVFAPLATEEGDTREWPVAIYTLNLECTAPRPSLATDREIIEDFIDRRFLVVAVDFEGGVVDDHLAWSRDIHGLVQVFGGKWHSEQPWYTEHRKELLRIPGPHAGKEVTGVPSPNSSTGDSLSIDKDRIYVVPPGYTVDYHHVFNPDSGWERRPELFFDIIYPMPDEETRRLPVLLEQTASNAGDTVLNANTFFLYSWLFNGYAFASTKNVPPEEENAHLYPVMQAIRYLRWKADEFSLNGIVSTAGISKAARRAFRESHHNGEPTIVDDLPYGGESSKVAVTMPAVGAGSLLDSDVFANFPIWENLNENSPAVVLGYHHLNPKDVAKHRGRKEILVRDAYLAKGWEDKLFYRDVSLGGHEYNIYDLDAILAFWDRFCKPNQR